MRYNRISSMRFVASKRFLLLLVLGIIPLSLSWQLPAIRPFVLAFDVLLIVAAAIDLLISRGLPAGLSLRRELNGRFAIGDPAKVAIIVENDSPRTIHLRIKDEYPPEMKLTDDREASFKIGPREETRFEYWLTPPRRGLYHFGHIAGQYLRGNKNKGGGRQQGYQHKADTAQNKPFHWILRINEN